MRCFNDFKNDRICDLCKINNSKQYYQCKINHKYKLRLKTALNYIENHCPHSCEHWDLYVDCKGCSLNNKTKDVSIKDCVPTLKCKQYLSDEQKIKVDELLNKEN